MAYVTVSPPVLLGTRKRLTDGPLVLCVPVGVAAPGRRQAGAPREVYRADVEPLFATADQQVCDVAMPFVTVV